MATRALARIAAAVVAAACCAGMAVPPASAAPPTAGDTVELMPGGPRKSVPVQVLAAPARKPTTVGAPTPRRRVKSSLTTSGATAVAPLSVTYSGFSPEAQAAFQAAVDIVSSVLTIEVPVHVQATFEPLPSGVLGSAGSWQSWGLTRNGVSSWYPSPLANQLVGYDIDSAQGAPAPEVEASFSSSYSNWYFGTDGKPPSGTFDFTTVVLHELWHGLGFAGSGDVVNGSGSWGYGSGTPFIYDRGVVSDSGTALIDTTVFPNPSTRLGSLLTGNGLRTIGALAVRGAGGLTRPKLYAPSTWAPGSSYSHLDESTYPAGNVNSLMTYAIGPGEVIHTPGPISLGMFADMGWHALVVPAAPTGVSAQPTVGGATVTWTPPSDNGGDAVQVYRVRSSSGTVTDVPASSTSVNVDGLTPGTSYTFTVQAVNGIGPSPASSPSAAVTPQEAAARITRPAVDFDGDGRADRAVWRPSTGQWFVEGAAEQSWGLTGDVPVPGDYDADGRTDRAVWRPSDGGWYVQGQPLLNFGLADDVPVPGDYDGDGDTDRAVWRPSTGQWLIAGQAATSWGLAGDVPVPGDYDGDGRTDLAVWRPTDGGWYVALSSGGTSRWFWGLASDIPVPGDFDGDGDVEPAVWRGTDGGGWYVLDSTEPTVFWGLRSFVDEPQVGDYDGDGRADRVVWRPDGGGWYTPSAATVHFGLDGDVPLQVPFAIRRTYS